MRSFYQFPERVAVRVAKPGVEGLAIGLCFYMQRKNHYTYTVFLDCNGEAEVLREELLLWFAQEVSASPMDYIHPLGGFTGQVSARVRTTEELRRALAVFDDFRRYYRYPEGYGASLQRAAARGQDPDEYHVEVSLFCAGEAESE